VAVLLAGAACTRVPDDPAAAYAMLCARCHGQDGRGNPEIRVQRGLDLTRSELMARGGVTAARQRIAEGKGTMPAFGRKLTAEQLDRLAAYAFGFGTLPAPPAEGVRQEPAPSASSTPGPTASDASASSRPPAP
jgi:mono/diheme cytochrome c family protein